MIELETEHIRIFVDGSSKGNPGKGYSLAIFKMEGKIWMRDKYLDYCTNNQAEYEAFYLALKELKEMKGQLFAEIRTDSQLIDGHINRGWKINENKSLIAECLSLYYSIIARGNKLKVVWIPREENEAGKKIETGLRG